MALFVVLRRQKHKRYVCWSHIHVNVEGIVQWSKHLHELKSEFEQLYTALNYTEIYGNNNYYNFFLENVNSYSLNSEVLSMHSSIVLCATMLASTTSNPRMARGLAIMSTYTYNGLHRHL